MVVEEEEVEEFITSGNWRGKRKSLEAKACCGQTGIPGFIPVFGPGVPRGKLFFFGAIRSLRVFKTGRGCALLQVLAARVMDDMTRFVSRNSILVVKAKGLGFRV